MFINVLPLETDKSLSQWLSKVEQETAVSLANYLEASFCQLRDLLLSELVGRCFFAWIEKFPAQILLLSLQITWTLNVEKGITTATLSTVCKGLEYLLSLLADSVLDEQPFLRRRKTELLITELVHQRDVVRELIARETCDIDNFDWLRYMRFYYNSEKSSIYERVSIHVAEAFFFYGFEYLGVPEPLVQTPLTDSHYLTMTQALKKRLGGSPFGPAGTGKTESVKALGRALGRFVIVFNCNESFDFKAMGRIFVGLCQVGAWGCFDEFNRLEERILSAVSQQIQTIQTALSATAASGATQMGCLGSAVTVNPDVAIFITMNPTYAGRSNLPGNLKQLFRPFAMTAPDAQLIVQVMLYSQGFQTAEHLSKKIVSLYRLCEEQLSRQSHYDFGLRALKAVLLSAGSSRRTHCAGATRGSQQDFEQEILVTCVCETLKPKLVDEDIPLFESLVRDVFPDVVTPVTGYEKLKGCILELCQLSCYVAAENWIEKIYQIYLLQKTHHGVMLVGLPGSGKTSAWRTLLQAVSITSGVEHVSYVIDPKVLSKDELYGALDYNTREWTDGLFTHILRKIVDNVRNENKKFHWIVFDGDVDPEWAENLNSVLDDNKLLTLPNGERLPFPANARLLFEVQNLDFATPATVSRCGMVWFGEDTLAPADLFAHYFSKLRHQCIAGDISNEKGGGLFLATQQECADFLEPHFAEDGLVCACLSVAARMEHVMKFSKLRALESLFTLLTAGVRRVLDYNSSHEDFPLSTVILEKYLTNYLVFSLVWSFCGDLLSTGREQLEAVMRPRVSASFTIPQSSIIDHEVQVSSGEWSPWSLKVAFVEVEAHKITNPDVVVPTMDTIRHQTLLRALLAEHKPLLLCGPPGSGKTMTLLNALRNLPEMEVVCLNFSSATTPNFLLKALHRYCEYKRTPDGRVLAPSASGKWLAVFCDEINLPDPDRYGTQPIISFLRQLVERRGFWQVKENSWVSLERIQFIGACNPPTDPGRKILTPRFLRHVSVVLVDYPRQESLLQIYKTFNRALLRLHPSLRGYCDPLTEAMVEVYARSQARFTVDQQPHYLYSPRELTRWCRGIYEAVRSLDLLTPEALIRTWAHEALRLFQDRLVTSSERSWTDSLIDSVAVKHFPNVDHKTALKRPILYSNWLSKDYVSVDIETLRQFVNARLKVFYEEELDVPLVLFDEVLDNVLRIDRVFRQSQGHVLIIGVSGSGRTTLSRFVAWMNGFRTIQIKAHSKYTMAAFDDDLRAVLKLTGCKGEKVAFILDESNMLGASFLERINTLLANGEVPGLFEGDEYSTWLTQCTEAAQREGVLLDSPEELYKWFSAQVMQNLHVVFTMNPTEAGLTTNLSASPALFNRCVINWFGDWTPRAFYRVGCELTAQLDLEDPTYTPPSDFPSAISGFSPQSFREAVVCAFVYVHQSLQETCMRVHDREERKTHITPRHYLSFIKHFASLLTQKQTALEDLQVHISVGLQKLAGTVQQVEELRKELSAKKLELERKEEQANQKLKQMVENQQEAEREKASFLAIQVGQGGRPFCKWLQFLAGGAQ
jgi:dynein heavy chain 1